MRAAVSCNNLEKYNWSEFCVAQYIGSYGVKWAGRFSTFYIASCNLQATMSGWRTYSSVHKGCFNNSTMKKWNHDAWTYKWEGPALYWILFRSTHFSEHLSSNMYLFLLFILRTLASHPYEMTARTCSSLFWKVESIIVL